MLLIISGLLVGILTFLGPSVILLCLVICGIFYFIENLAIDNKNPLKKIVTAALVMRVSFFSAIIYITYCSGLDSAKYPVNIVGHTIQVVRDFGREIINGSNIARYLRGEFGAVAVKTISHHGFGFLHSGAWTQGLLNVIFGESVFNLLLFPIIDLWNLLLVFLLARMLFGERAALLSSAIYAFMPSFIIIAATNVRFCMGELSFLLIMLSLVDFAKRNRIRSLVFLYLASAVFFIFKDKAGKLLFLILPFCIFAALNMNLRKKIVVYSLIIIALVSFSYKNRQVRDKAFFIAQNLISSQKGFNMGVDAHLYSNYKIYDEFIYQSDEKTLELPILLTQIAKGLVRGICHLMLAPFPWETRNVLRLYYYPQNILWYLLLPVSLIGIAASFLKKYNTRLSFPIMLLNSFFLIVLSLTIGNEGIAIRYRDLVTPFFYIFAGFTLSRLL